MVMQVTETWGSKSNAISLFLQHLPSKVPINKYFNHQRGMPNPVGFKDGRYFLIWVSSFYKSLLEIMIACSIIDILGLC